MNIGGAQAGLPSLAPPLLGVAALPLPDIARALSLEASASPVDIVPPLPGEPRELKASLQFLLQTIDQRVFGISPPNHSATAEIYAHQTYAQDAMLREARTFAEVSLAKAVHAMESFESRRIPDAVEPRAVIALANQFIETGQYANYLRAAELASVVDSWYEPRSPHPNRPVPNIKARPVVPDALKSLWRRAPQLVLLAAWLLAGPVAVILARMFKTPGYEVARGVSIWATGFLVLVVFQFVATVRSYRPARRRPLN